MGIFGPSKSELADRIDDLETRIDMAEQRASDAQQKSVRANSRGETALEQATNAVEKAEQAQEANTHLVKAINSVAQFGEVEDKGEKVETLDEPRIGWKATANCIVRLLLPAGTTIVHPSHRRFDDVHKKRCDGAIPIAFHEPPYGGADFPQHAGGVKNEYVDESKHTTAKTFERHNDTFEYKLGEIAEPEKVLNEDIGKECESGIHFFCTEEEAVQWY